ncbi:riboflavin synthase [Peptococcus simiae]|uniref:Riboflavin synthase n=1 Tax=Peptococcus simiae TaxID=1643805 RepID=A0ABW9GYQ0_9FIRM
MFTGLIDRTGILQALEPTASGLELTILASPPYDQLVLGESIAVNGMCLTVTKIKGHAFSADVSRESIHRSNIAQLSRGDAVNLERAMAMGGRFGGHIVSGHLDGTGQIVAIVPDGQVKLFSLDIGSDMTRWVVEKGSIAIDGISLTLAKVEGTIITIAVIPHSLQATTLEKATIGQTVNIECDILAKYVEKMLAGNTSDAQPDAPADQIDLDFLAQHGYL